MATKLTLSVRSSTIAKAKKYAKRHGLSVSKIFEDYISSITNSDKKDQDDPFESLKRLKGVAGSVNKKKSNKDLIVDAILEKNLR